MTLLETSPAQCQWEFGRSSIRAVLLCCGGICSGWHTDQDWPMPGNVHLFDERGLPAFYLDLLANDLCFFPFTLVLVLVGVLWIEFLDVQVFNVGDGICNAPGNVLVMPDDDAG